MNNVKCPNCGNENKNTNIRCEFCGTELNQSVKEDNFLNRDYSQENVKVINLETKKAKHIISIILIFILAPWFLLGFAFIGVSTYSKIYDNNKSKNYLETEGKLVSYDYQYDELYNGVYEYCVNDIIYRGSPNLLSNPSGFKQTITVKYNPNNPSEYVMDSGWNKSMFCGIIMVIVTLGIFILIKILLKKISNKDTITLSF